MNRWFFWLYNWFQGEVLNIPGRLIALFFFVLLALVPLFTQNEFYLSILTLGSIYAIYAASWDVLAGFTGQVNLGHALFFGVAAYTVALLNIHFGLTPWITIPVGALCAVIFGLIVALPAMRLRSIYLALVTLGFPIILTGIILVFSEFTGGELGLSGIRGLTSSTIINYYITFFVMLVSLFLMFKITDAESKFIRVGVILHAIREDEITARSSGISTKKYKLLIFAFSGFFAGIAGSLYAHIIKITGPSTLEVVLSFQAILWTMFGGMGSIYGPVTGVFILFPLTELLGVFKVGQYIRFVLVALILIITLLFMPEGLSPWVRRKIEVKCPRCRLTNMVIRKTCRACGTALSLE